MFTHVENKRYHPDNCHLSTVVHVFSSRLFQRVLPCASQAGSLQDADVAVFHLQGSKTMSYNVA